MARNKHKYDAQKGLQDSFINSNKASIGDDHVAAACGRINDMAVATVNLMVPQRFELEQTLPWLFADDTLAKLRQVKGMVSPASRYKTYHPLTHGVLLTINFENASVPAIESPFFRPDPARAAPLLNTVEEIRAIYLQFEKVKHVLRWMNRYASAGAIRHYWPTALQLCPNAPAFAELRDSSPTRFGYPSNIGEMLMLIRETASIMSSAAMLPKNAPTRDASSMWLTFIEANFNDGTHGFATDQQIFYL